LFARTLLLRRDYGMWKWKQNEEVLYRLTLVEKKLDSLERRLVAQNVVKPKTKRGRPRKVK
jgi:hypothetical protein